MPSRAERMKKFNNIINASEYRAKLENNIIKDLMPIILNYVPHRNLNKKMVLNDEIKQLGKNKAVIRFRRTKAYNMKKKAQEQEQMMIEEEDRRKVHKYCIEKFSNRFKLDYYGPNEGFTVRAKGRTYIFEHGITLLRAW